MKNRITPFVRKAIHELASQERMPTLVEVMIRLGCDNAKAENIFKSIKIKRKILSGLTGTMLPGMHRTGKEGFIYLVQNPAFEGWVKCGMTVDCGDRLKSYNGYDPICRFSFITTKRVENRRQAETQLLKEVSFKSSLQNGEWFKIDESLCIEIFDQIQ